MTKFKRLVSGVILSVLCLGCLAGCTKNNTTVTESTQIPPLSRYEINDEQIERYNSNGTRYDPQKVEMLGDHPLFGKTIYWLGSSVTDGAGAEHNSMADYLAARTGCICVKEAVSGTTLLDIGRDDGGSYTYRLANSTVFDKSAKIDAFIVQISTNDALDQNLEYRGSLTAAEVMGCDGLDLSTTMGGVEYIIQYVTDTWHCPVYFYSGAYFDDEGVRSSRNPAGRNYAKLVSDVASAVEKWSSVGGYEVSVIDLYNDEAFNELVTDSFYKWCMLDAVHPKKAGYLQWWMPYFEERLTQDLTAVKKTSGVDTEESGLSIASKVGRAIMKKADMERDKDLTMPENVSRISDICYGPEKEWNVLDVFRPADIPGKLPVIVNFHGGSWIYGDKETYKYYCADLAAHGFACISFTYRLAPEFKYPSALEDMQSVMKWLCENADAYGLDTNNVFAVGDSAGAHMLAVYCCIQSNEEYAQLYNFETVPSISFNAIALNCGKYDMDHVLENDANLMYIMSDLLPQKGTAEELYWITPFHYMIALSKTEKHK